MAQPDDAMISKSAACRLLGITRQWLNRLQADGLIPSGPRGQVPLVGAVQGYLRSLEDTSNRRGGTEAARIASARASELELRNRAKSAELIPRWEIEHALSEVSSLAEVELAALAGRIRTTPETRAMITREAKEAAARIAETRAATLQFLEKGAPVILC